MRTSILPTVLILFATNISAQQPEAAVTDSTGLPGDHFNLQGALELFKDANDLEQFEQALNTEGNQVNNLDLDGNGEIDYVRVESYKEGDAVAVVLRVPMSKEESQDIAVIELEKTGEESATLQIRGDDELYLEGTIIEPFQETEDTKDGKGPSAPALVRVRITVNVWAWSCPRWCFSARFVPWSSPWYWAYYPGWWKPWHPHPWRAWWGWGARYRTWYRPWSTCRVAHAHAIYGPRRVHSPVVHARYVEAHHRYEQTHPVRTSDPRSDHKSNMKRSRLKPASTNKAAPKAKQEGPKPTKPAHRVEKK